MSSHVTLVKNVEVSLQEEHAVQLTYELVKRDGVKWSSLFQRMEGIAARFDIADYSLSQTTLEQVTA